LADDFMPRPDHGRVAAPSARRSSITVVPGCAASLVHHFWHQVFGAATLALLSFRRAEKASSLYEFMTAGLCQDQRATAVQDAATFGNGQLLVSEVLRTWLNERFWWVSAAKRLLQTMSQYSGAPQGRTWSR